MDRIRERIRAKLRVARESAGLDGDDRKAVEQGLLPLFDDLAYRYYLREDGAVFTLDALAPEEGLQEMTNGTERLTIHRIVVEEDPKLAELIPPRPTGEVDCTKCQASGRAPVLAIGGAWSSTICLDCRGTGWVPAEKAERPGRSLTR